MYPNKFVSAGSDFCTYERAVAAPLFKKEFYLEKGNAEGEIIIGCTGFFELYVNGENLTGGILVPFQANSERTVFYKKYSLENLRAGKNSIYVLLGNGFANPIGGEIWDQYKLKTRGAPAFALSFSCGELSFTAEDFTWTRSPLLFDDYRIGTYFDAREIDKIKNGECTWSAPLQREEPTGVKRLADFEPIGEIKRLVPTVRAERAVRDYRIRDEFKRLHRECCIMKSAPKYGGIIYDFGENTSGVPILKVRNTTPGQVIYMQFSEFTFEGFVDYINVDVYPDGCCQQDIYVCKGAKEEIYSPSFTYHGGRFCYLYGAEQCDVELELSVVRNTVSLRSDFECSEEISNEIFRVCRNSDSSNLHNILSDCPTREKNGWTGDAAISADHFLMGFGAERVFAAWLACIRDMQGEDGSIPCIVPSHGGCSDSVIWDSILFAFPFYCYKYNGDRTIIEDNAEAMMKNLKYHLGFCDERGLVDRGMGDWLPVDYAAASYASPLGFCCSAIMAEMCRMGEIMMRAVVNEQDARFYAEKRAELVSAIRKEYIQEGIVGKGRTEKYRKPLYRECQTSQAIGLFFDIFEEKHKHAAAEKLVSLIHENGDSFDCGFLGIRAIFHVLSQYGYGNLAHKMITKPTHPSFANMIYRGETTVWERFMYPGGRIGSHNHHFMAEPSMWYLSDVVGIKVNPEMKNSDDITICPDFIKGLEYAKGCYENKNGRVEVEWRRTCDGIALEVVKYGGLTVSIGVEERSDIKVNYIEK